LSKVLGIDYGDARIGIALSDEFGWMARGLRVVNARKKRIYVLEEIMDIINENAVKTVVIGYPINMDGSKGERTIVTDNFAAELGEMASGLDIIKWDERLTSVSANRAMREMGISQRVKGMNDMLSAIFILQGYLDSKSKN
jgi:putative Holliday junction resolvase